MSTKDFSIIQERQIAEFLHWEVVVGSGATACRPGDVKSDTWLGECKTHITNQDKVTFRVTHWVKITEESQSAFKKPILFTDDGTQSLSNTWCMIPCSFMSNLGKELNPTKVYRLSSKTLMFNSQEMYREMHTHANMSDNPYFVVQFGGDKVAVLHIDTFKECFGEIV